MDPLDFDAQEQALLQQQARIKALRAIGAGLPEAPGESPGWTSAVTGTRIGGRTLKTPTAALLNPLIGTIGAELGESRLNQQTSALKQAEQADYERLLSQTPRGVTVPIGPDEPTGSFQGSNADIMASINGMSDPVERQRALQGYQNQLAGNMKTVEPTRQQMVEHATKLNRNPLGRALSAKMVEDLMVAAPTRDQALLQKTLENLRAQQNLDRTFGETQRHNLATENKPSSGNWIDSGQSLNGVKVLIQPGDGVSPRKLMTADGKFSWTQGGQPQATPVGTAPPVVNAPSMPAAPPGELQPTPTPLSAEEKRNVRTSANSVNAFTDLRTRLDTLPTTLGGRVLGKTLADNAGVLGQAGGVGIVGDSLKAQSVWNADFTRESNQQLQAMAGMNVTASEVSRHRATMPGPMTDPAVRREWLDRAIAFEKVDAARTQALGSNKFARLDAEANAVVDQNGKIIPGTESPYPELRKGAAAGPAAQPTGTDGSLAELVSTTDSTRAAYLARQLGLDKQGADVQARVAKARANGWTDAQIIQQLKGEVRQ